MHLDQRAIRYFKRKRRGGKNLFARALDLLFGSAALSFALFFLFWRMHTGLRQAIVLALTLSALLIVLYMGFSRYSLEKFMSKVLVALPNQCTREKL